jgi:glyoxylase-like metal-dependent hydrolase (beta-lactamase superfamily II)
MDQGGATQFARDGRFLLVADDVAGLMQPIVNLYFVGPRGAGDRAWVLIDAGLPGTAWQIANAAAERFGPESRPAAIMLTHGHFDHIGGLPRLADEWDAPIYAHALELPYLTGRSPYPPPDPTVGGGMARMSPLYPRGPFDFGARVRALPADGAVPHLPGWRAIHTPGHAPGHVSLFRDADRLILAGDAFVTTRQESAVAALTKPLELHGPPAYFTPDWEAARRSVAALAALAPEVAATGHGLPMRGEVLRRELRALANDFDRLGVPTQGRYVGHPAVTDEHGVVSVPPPAPDPFPAFAAGAAVAGTALFALWRARGSVRGDSTGM